MAWPTLDQYQSALQHPAHFLSHPDLQKAEVEKKKFGMLSVPFARSGNFGAVYKLEHQDRRFALKVFIRENPERHRRYRLISEEESLREMPSFLRFEYLEKGIRIDRGWFPALVMDWGEGKTLDKHLQDCFDRNCEPDSRKLCDAWIRTVSEMQERGVAHGDLQHGNILVKPDQGMTLVDYDGMYVPSMRSMNAVEIGLPAYQHPERGASSFGPELDDFSAMLILFQLMVVDRELWSLFHKDDTYLLLSRQDWLDPQEHPLFRHVRESKGERARELGDLVKAACRSPLSRVPHFRDVAADFSETPAGDAGADFSGTPAHEESGPERPAPSSLSLSFDMIPPANLPRIVSRLLGKQAKLSGQPREAEGRRQRTGSAATRSFGLPRDKEKNPASGVLFPEPTDVETETRIAIARREPGPLELHLEPMPDPATECVHEAENERAPGFGAESATEPRTGPESEPGSGHGIEDESGSEPKAKRVSLRSLLTSAPASPPSKETRVPQEIEAASGSQEVLSCRRCGAELPFLDEERGIIVSCPKCLAKIFVPQKPQPEKPGSETDSEEVVFLGEEDVDPEPAWRIQPEPDQPVAESPVEALRKIVRYWRNLKTGQRRVAILASALAIAALVLAWFLAPSNTIGVNETRRGFIGRGEIEVYACRIRWTQEVRIHLARDPGSRLNPYLTLQSSEGRVIARDDNGGGGLDAQIVREMEAGNYRIVIRDRSGRNSGGYTLSVRNPSGEE